MYKQKDKKYLENFTLSDKYSQIQEKQFKSVEVEKLNEVESTSCTNLQKKKGKEKNETFRTGNEQLFHRKFFPSIQIMFKREQAEDFFESFQI